MYREMSFGCIKFVSFERYEDDWYFISQTMRLHQPGHPVAPATNKSIVSQNQLFVVEWHEEPLRLLAM